MAPPVFGQRQLYVIRAPLDSTCVTCVYALLVGQSQAEYEEKIRAVVTRQHLPWVQLQPGSVVVVMDFRVVRDARHLWRTWQSRPSRRLLSPSDAEYTWRKVCDFYFYSYNNCFICCIAVIIINYNTMQYKLITRHKSGANQMRENYIKNYNYKLHSVCSGDYI